MLLVALFGAAALVLAVVGIYGLVSYTVSRRAPEMGIRIALGAQAGDILRMVLRRAGFLAGAGVLAGSLAAFFLARLMAGVLFGISPAAPLVYLAVAGLVAASAIAASYGPARRASRVDPVAALRGE